ncbi:aldose 1-epimerase family protein [Aestuariibaculum suncheonense]|uniref:Aldose 1-epimerase family protein n=1 Tax=Aestuariibaculum suncheonense TaxID=1028745 RepID=A0A8J6Q761_9FLAO|nr:aldose 1-epimerase family protein [Aestuariibaculum suncheonense]MBD0835838.1 aldose 1-epimerase family protein [Aestuariibaculum suncheonense]
MFTLENDLLKIGVKKTGAELCEISAVKNKTQFMWDANPDVWAGFAPNLFPIIGALKDNTYLLNNKAYNLPKHGFIRDNDKIELHKQTQDSLTFKRSYDETSLKVYPFKFEFFITYKLKDSTLDVIHTIKNLDDNTMYFSLGGHPAFKCPVHNNETYTDYSLIFEHTENSETHMVSLTDGLIFNETAPLFNNTNIIRLTHDLFDKDALIFKDLKSKKVTLNSKNSGDILTVSYHDFPYLGIWAKPTGDYVCIEPWLGIADSVTHNQDFKTKEGILTLEPGKTFMATYSIEIHKTHLV